MTEKRTEQDLLAECKNGSRKAFEALFTMHQRRVFSVALNFFGGKHDLAEDVTQQVFLKIYQRIGDFRAEAQFTTWLYRITVNCCLDEQRKTRKFFSIEEFFSEFKVKKTQENKVFRKEIADEVQKAIATMNPKFRLPILLKYSEDLSYNEIAAVLECSPGTVASRLNRGHKMLAQKLKHLRNEI